MLNDLIAEYPTAHRDKLEKILSCAYALASPESSELGLHSFPIENIPNVAKLIVSKIQLHCDIIIGAISVFYLEGLHTFK